MHAVSSSGLRPLLPGRWSPAARRGRRESPRLVTGFRGCVAGQRDLPEQFRPAALGRPDGECASVMLGTLSEVGQATAAGRIGDAAAVVANEEAELTACPDL